MGLATMSTTTRAPDDSLITVVKADGVGDHSPARICIKYHNKSMDDSLITLVKADGVGDHAGGHEFYNKSTDDSLITVVKGDGVGDHSPARTCIKYYNKSTDDSLITKMDVMSTTTKARTTH